MKRVSTLVGFLGILAVLSHAASAAADDKSPSARVGEIRAFAITRTNADAIADMHQSGWIEARGQLLSASAFPELYRVVRRDWTASDVREGQFALPEVRDERFQRAIETNAAYRVLGPELVTGGRTLKTNGRLSPISYWIFAGRVVRSSDSVNGDR